MDINLFIGTIKNAIGALSSVQSNEVLRERITFIYEQLEVIRKSNEATVKELTEAKAKIIELEKQIASYREKDEFVEHMGASFRKNPSGDYITSVYCPNCLKQVGSGFPHFPFQCRTCGWLSSFKGRELKHIMSSLP